MTEEGVRRKEMEDRGRFLVLSVELRKEQWHPPRSG
jgi:hypothetical protein